MQTQDTDSTQPGAATRPPAKAARRRWSGLLIGLLVLAAFLLVVGLGGYSGYQRGLDDRVLLESTRLAEDLQHQLDLGVADYDAGQYDRARQRFEYVLQYDPSNTRAIEMLARVLTIVNVTATPTLNVPTPTPTLSPTPDLRSVEEKLTQARQNMAAEEWDTAIQTLLNLRKEDPAYAPVEVDSMLYVAYRNRGVNKILLLGQLEGGLYDLAQSELFGPLDADARNYRDWARFYLLGASFWQVNWGQAAYYFGQLAFSVPNLNDGNGWTAGERYAEALAKYVDTLAAASDWCNAEVQFDLLQQYSGQPELEPTRTYLSEQCSPPEPEPQPTDPSTPTPTPTPTATPVTELVVSTPTFTPEPPTPEPSATPEPPTATTEGRSSNPPPATP